ncbi:hypothetical protein DVJ77_01865 [Dyella tabacisoli]|uniref:Uncharacterized protein n=1 Tax=Dyella tabacisoli TaxID=2282381 RepID=A0A369URR5_9GAMM|nr:hypothetical protein DVJ77_01865 [Dyella tabacisoli]
MIGEDLENVTSYYDNGGHLLKALAYRDAYGNYRILAFGGNVHGPKRDSESYVSLHAYGFLQDHGGYLARWEIKDANGGPLCGLKMLTPLVDIIDAGDGQSLVMVPYWIDCDGLDPTEVKLIMVYKDRKYAIRGNLPNQEGDEITRTPGETFKELPAVVQKTALAYWERVEAAAKKAADRSNPNVAN